MARVVGYLRVSTASQDLDKNRDDVLRFAHLKGLHPVEFVEETVSTKVDWKLRKLYQFIQSLEEGDAIITPEMSRLGRSMLEVMTILNHCMDGKIRVFAVKGNWSLDGTLQSKILAMAFAIASEVERDLIASRTKEALRVRQQQGVKLGRPTGPGKSKLDPHLREIVNMLSMGSPVTFVAQHVGTTPANLRRFLNLRGVDHHALKAASVTPEQAVQSAQKAVRNGV